MSASKVNREPVVSLELPVSRVQLELLDQVEARVLRVTRVHLARLDRVERLEQQEPQEPLVPLELLVQPDSLD